MTTFLIIFLVGLFIGYLIVAIPKSIYQPGTRKIQAAMLFGKLWRIFINIEGKTIYKGATIPGTVTKGNIIDIPLGSKNRINLYFFLWPFIKVYSYPLTYTKSKKIGEEQPGDIIIRRLEKSMDIWVSRTGISNHLEFREDYPNVSIPLQTKEIAHVIIYTNDMLEITNPELAFFGIKNWFTACTEILNGAKREIVAGKELLELNELKSEAGADSFSEMMKIAVNKSLEKFGVKLYKSILKDFDPFDEKAKKLMDSFTDITIAKNEGDLAIIKADKEGDALRKTANAKADAYEAEQKKIVEWRKKFLVDTGLAKVDGQGNIIELIPDANTKISADALKELSKLTGTLVLDSGSLNKMFNISSTNN